MMKSRTISILIILGLFLSACAQNAASTEAGRGSVAGAPLVEMAAPSMDAIAMEAPVASGGVANSTTSTTSAETLVIQTASVSIMVDDPATTLDSITSMARGLGGYVVTSNLYRTLGATNQEVQQANITLRVPVESLNTAMDQIHSLVTDPATDILSETISGEDVTATVVDLRSRLTNLQHAEARLIEIMDASTTTEDTLMVFNQLTYIQEQIEVLQGQIQYYTNSADMSAISVDIQARASIAPIEVGGWHPAGIARDSIQALIDTLQFLASALIWLGTFCLPISLVTILPLFFIIRGLRRKGWFTRKPRTSKLPPENQPPAA